MDGPNKATELVKKVLKKAVKVASKFILSIISPVLIVLLILVILSASLYFLMIDDGSWKNSADNVPNAAGSYAGTATVNADGSISYGGNIQEVWDNLISNNSRVREYLDSPEELAKLINVQTVTRMPDTRSDPNEPINWDEVDFMNNSVPGIVKFIRADKDGNTSTMTYATPDDFYSWIEDANVNGNEESKRKALNSFTIQQNTTVTLNNNVQVTTTSSGVDPVADISQAILDATGRVGSPGEGLCQAWVRQVYELAGLGNEGQFGSAFEAYQSVCVSTDRNNIPVGATVYGTGSKGKEGIGNPYGHVGIYIGNGLVKDNIGYINTQTLDEWIGWQERAGNVLDGRTGWLGWGWQSSQPSTMTQGSGTSSTTQQTEQQQTLPSFSIVVATWEQTRTTIQGIPNAESSGLPIQIEGYTNSDITQYIMRTTTINYQQMIDKYTMPFELLWALLVIGENKNFVMELADLVYGSQIEVTIQDNYTKKTQIDTWNYDKDQYITYNVGVRLTRKRRSTNTRNTSMGEYNGRFFITK